MANELIWRAEIPLSDVATSIGRTAGDLGIDRTPEFQLEKIRRPGEKVATDAQLEAGDVLGLPRHRGRRPDALGQPRFGLARQDLYPGVVLQRQADSAAGPMRTRGSWWWRPRPPVPASPRPGRAGMCLVTAQSAAVLTDHPWSGSGEGRRQGAADGQDHRGDGDSAGCHPVQLVRRRARGLIATAGATLMVLTRVLTPRSAAGR